MTDIEDLRTRYAAPPPCPVCAGPSRVVGVLVVCAAAWDNGDNEHLGRAFRGAPKRTTPYDPAVLALCDEVEALRAKVAAAPEVLREWPKTVEEAPGEWFFCIHGDCAPRGTFATRDGYALPVFEDESGGSLWVSGEMKPGEFFVRVS